MPKLLFTIHYSKGLSLGSRFIEDFPITELKNDKKIIGLSVQFWTIEKYKISPDKFFKIKNNPKSDYAKVCSNKGSGMHGIEFRAYATRVGFKIFEKEERYQVTFRFDVIIGFSYSEFT